MTFKHEERYVVLKLKDLDALTTSEAEALYCICTKVLNHRKAQHKPPLRTVVVEQDWPEYEMVWAAIEQRMAKPNIHVETRLDHVLSVAPASFLKIFNESKDISEA